MHTTVPPGFGPNAPSGPTSKQKKFAILAGVLAVGGGVVAYDALVLRADPPVGPASAAAAAPLTPGDETAPAPDAGRVVLTGAPRLAGHLERLGQSLRLDPLDAPDAFRPAAEPDRDAKVRSVTPDRAGAESAFRAHHELTAVLVGNAGGQAVVNGRVLRVGQSIGGFRLERVEPGVATFSRGDQVEILRVERPG